MTEYEKLLDKMQFTIGTTLVDNDYCRKIEKHDELNNKSSHNLDTSQVEE